MIFSRSICLRRLAVPKGLELGGRHFVVFTVTILSFEIAGICILSMLVLAIFFPLGNEELEIEDGRGGG